MEETRTPKDAAAATATVTQGQGAPPMFSQITDAQKWANDILMLNFRLQTELMETHTRLKDASEEAQLVKAQLVKQTQLANERLAKNNGLMDELKASSKENIQLKDKLKALQAQYDSAKKGLSEKMCALEDTLKATKSNESTTYSRKAMKGRDGWVLPSGWKDSLEIFGVNCTGSDELELEALSSAKAALLKQSSLESQEALDCVTTSLSATFNQRHGRHWHCVAGRAGLLASYVWPREGHYIALDVVFKAVHGTLRIILFQSMTSEWGFPADWKEGLHGKIVTSFMSRSMASEAVDVIVRASLEQTTLRAADDVSEMAKHVRANWERVHPGNWHVVAGKPGHFVWYVRFQDGRYIAVDVENATSAETLRIVLFETKN